MEHAVRLKRANPRLIAGVVALVIVVTLTVLVVIPWLSEVARPAAPAYWPTTGWRTSTPEAQGIDSDSLAAALLAIREQNIPVHSLLVVRNGYVVADATFYPYDGQTVHDLASVTKSVMTTLIGIAADQGKLDLDDKMVSFFPGRSIANLDEAKEQITVRHLASMTSGLACAEASRGSSEKMRASPDWAQYALDQRMAWEPGERFEYCNPAIHLLSPILQQATGLTALEFAHQNLFAPLGIEEAMWESDPQGYYDGWGDLSLHPQDMAKIGFLFLNHGRWDGRQIVSRQWVEEATSSQIVSLDGEESYGYGWWPDTGLEGVYRADGLGGQHIVVLPDWNMIVVTTGGGFELDQIGQSLLASFVEMEKPLPANPEGVTRLEAAIDAVSQPPPAEPVAPLPEVAQTISGQTYVLEPSAIELESVAFEFDGTDEATGHFEAGGRERMSWSIGLDGVYRFSSGLDGRPLALRGKWTGPQTFYLEYNSVPTNDRLLLQFHFDGDQVEVTAQQTGGGPQVQVAGRLQEPQAK